MDRRTFLSSAAALVIAGASTAQAAEPAKGNGDGRVVELPKPDMKGGKPLMECLALRRTNRTFTDAELSLELLSGLLWSAWGINRENGKHVIPTAMNYQKLIVFAVRGDGVWQYLPEKNAVKRVIAGDQRSRFDRSGCILLYCVPGDDPFGSMHCGSAYQGVGRFSVEEARVLCEECASRSRGGGIVLSAKALDVLRDVQQEYPLSWPASGLSPQDRRQTAQAIDAFVQYHLGFTWERGRFLRV